MSFLAMWPSDKICSLLCFCSCDVVACQLRLRDAWLIGFVTRWLIAVAPARFQFCSNK